MGSTPTPSAANSPQVITPPADFFAKPQDPDADASFLQKSDSTTHLNPQADANRDYSDEPVEEMRTEKEGNDLKEAKVNETENRDPPQDSVFQKKQPRLTLLGTTQTESSTDIHTGKNKDDIQTNDASEEKEEGEKNGSVPMAKKSVAHDSTVRKSYRAGITNTMGSNSSLDKVGKEPAETPVTNAVQSVIPTPPVCVGGASTAKRKLSLGKVPTKRRLSAGKKIISNFLTVPDKKPLSVSAFVASCQDDPKV